MRVRLLGKSLAVSVEQMAYVLLVASQHVGTPLRHTDVLVSHQLLVGDSAAPNNRRIVYPDIGRHNTSFYPAATMPPLYPPYKVCNRAGISARPFPGIYCLTS
jgi:hypothetical protein